MSEVYEDLIVMRVMKDILAQADKKARDSVELRKGSRETVWVIVDGEEVELGYVLRTKPKPEAKVRDEDALGLWIANEHADQVAVSYEVTDVDQAVAVLLDAGRSDLVELRTHIPEYVRAQALRDALAGAEIPGVEVVTGDGYLTVKPSPHATSVVPELIRDRSINLRALLALEGDQP